MAACGCQLQPEVVVPERTGKVFMAGALLLAFPKGRLARCRKHHEYRVAVGIGLAEIIFIQLLVARVRSHLAVDMVQRIIVVLPSRWVQLPSVHLAEGRQCFGIIACYRKLCGFQRQARLREGRVPQSLAERDAVAEISDGRVGLESRVVFVDLIAEIELLAWGACRTQPGFLAGEPSLVG